MNSRLLCILLSLAALAVVAGGCAQPNVSTQPRAVVSQASGDFAVANSKNGQAIFRADGLAPGGTVSGTVELTNTGRLAGELGIEQADIRDRPGRNGGLLSQAVELAVQDVSNPADAITMFSGRLGELHERKLGSISPGQVRRYRFSATFPDRGAPPSFTTGDNAYIGSGLTVRYTWRATAAEPSPPTVTPPPTVLAEAPRVNYRVVLKRLLRRGRLDFVARCNKPCRLVGWAKLPKKARAKKATKTRRRGVTIARANKRVRLKIKVAKRSRRALVRQVRRTGKVTLRTYLTVSASGTKSRTLSRRVTVRKRAAARRGR